MAPLKSETVEAVSLPAPAEGHSMALRRGQPGASYTVTDARGLVSEIRANGDGVVRPTSGEQVRVADANNLPYWGDPLTSAERAALAAPKED